MSWRNLYYKLSDYWMCLKFELENKRDWLIRRTKSATLLFGSRLRISWKEQCPYCSNKSNEGEGQWICGPCIEHKR